MKKIYFIITTITLLLGLQDIKPAFAIDEPFYAAPKVRPNVLIILDRSGSMGGDVGGGTASTPCPTPAYPNPLITTGDYSRICIARQVLFDLLDANDDNAIDDTNDPTNLDVRLGYSRFVSVPSSPATGALEGGGYAGGNIRVINDVDTAYTTLWSNINSLTIGGYTPLGTALSEALQYFQNAPAVTGDGCITCRKNYVVLVTDGADTVTCTAGSESADNRRATVYAARALRNGPDGIADTDDDIPVFIVGFGGALPTDLQRTLNWAAYYGGTDNPSVANSGSTTNFTIPSGSTLCSAGTGDPGAQAFSGYAFLADNASALASSLQSIFGAIRQGSYSRSAPVLTTTGIGGANRIYAGFFDLGANVNWQGHLLAWNIDTTTGNLINSAINDPCTSSASSTTGALRELYDAGRTLTYSTCGGYVVPSARKVYTAVGSPTMSQIWFNVSAGSTAYDNTSMSNSNTQQIDLCNALNISGFNCTANNTSTSVGSANELVNFIRFGSPTFNGSGGARNNNWHLGDIWHSTPTIVGPPLGAFNNSNYKTFKNTYANRTQILILGANDGMLHAFDDNGSSARGSELWSFIPNNLLGKLQNLSTGHSFFVDASPTAADVCLNASNNCGTALEAATDWETVVISGERDGGKAYFALKLLGTTATTPEFKWEFTDANLGNTWSKPTIGKVRYNNGSNIVDKWVTFFGGGVSPTADVGNYVYAVDISNGSLLGSGPNATKKQVNSANTSNNVPSALRPVDFNGDYYVDAVYFGDTIGRMWRWDVSNLANNNNGTLTKFFDPGATHYYIDSAGNRVVEGVIHTNRPIYYRPAITVNKQFRPIIVFGTGNIDELAATPPSTITTDYVYAIRQEVGYTGTEPDQSGVTELWKIPLECYPINSACGERLAGAPMLYGGYVLFITYRPPTTNTCTENGNVVSCNPGSGWLYIVDLETGVILSPYPENIGSGLPAMTCSGDKCYTITSNNQDIQTKGIPSKYPPTAETIYWRER
ncbi:MAG: PilC/PilY family type IV pilus protein [Nitrospirota bacterium]